MSDLAYDADGDRFEVPEEVSGWRVRRFRNVGARGAPEVVFGDDGRPLIVDADITVDDFRAAVGGAPGRYRLDAVDERGRPVDKVPAAYLQFGDGTRPSSPAAASPSVSSDTMLAEVVRANAEMVKVIADRFGGVMEAAATLLKAADGAGLPARTPVEMPRNASGAGDDADEDEDEDEGDDRDGGIGDFLSQVMPLVQMVMSRKSSPAATPTRNAARIVESTPEIPKPAKKAAGPVTPEMLMHFQAIHAQLTDDEAEFARAVAAELSPEEVQQWMSELAGMSVDDAVAVIRKHIGGHGGAS